MPRCPACKIHCDLIEYEGLKVHNCGECGGYWLNALKLDRIVEKREIEMPEPVRQKMMDLADQHHRQQKLMCFSCSVWMEKRPFRIWDDIILDHCPKCDRIWLDQGELEKCQIYAEYLAEHPEEWKGQAAAERVALMEAQLKARREAIRNYEPKQRNVSLLSYVLDIFTGLR